MTVTAVIKRTGMGRGEAVHHRRVGDASQGSRGGQCPPRETAHFPDPCPPQSPLQNHLGAELAPAAFWGEAYGTQTLWRPGTSETPALDSHIVNNLLTRAPTIKSPYNNSSLI